MRVRNPTSGKFERSTDIVAVNSVHKSSNNTRKPLGRSMRPRGPDGRFRRAVVCPVIASCAIEPKPIKPIFNGVVTEQMEHELINVIRSARLRGEYIIDALNAFERM